MKCFISLIHEKKEQSYEQNGESKIMGSLSFSLLHNRSLSRRRGKLRLIEFGRILFNRQNHNF